MKRESSNTTEMFVHIESWKSSGLSQSAFCKQHQLKPPTFYYWLKRYRLKQMPVEQKGFIPVSLTPVKQGETPVLEVLGINGNRILFYDHVDPAYLKNLLR